MKTNAIRINDKENGVVSVSLKEILSEINHGKMLQWSILYLEAVGYLSNGKCIVDLEKEISQLENGLFISWNDLKVLSRELDQIYDIIIIGSKDISILQRYKDDHEMYDTCDIVIQMIDSSYWEVFSHDKDLINRLASKFKKIKPINCWEDLGEG